jgi:hypothetical protein
MKVTSASATRLLLASLTLTASRIGKLEPTRVDWPLAPPALIVAGAPATLRSA